MQSSIDLATNLSNKIIENPQTEQTRCRICYEEAKPLITLCQCSGSIAYVHEDCILDWITKKMESSESVQIPRCEICRVAYSARLKIGSKKICCKALLKKIRELKLAEIMTTLFFIIGIVIAVYVAATAIFSAFVYLINIKKASSQTNNGSDDGVIVKLFTHIIFPLFFLQAAIEHGKKRMKLWEDSLVQIVQLTLNPKITLKQ